MSVRGSRPVVFAVAAALLVVLAPVAIANSHSQEAVASQHTDFGTGTENAPKTLEGLEISGSGNPAELQLDRIYDVVDESGDGSTDGTQNLVGDHGSNTVFDSQIEIVPNTTGTMQNLTVDIGNTFGSDYGFTVDIWIIQEPIDSTVAEGTQVATWDPSFSTGEQEIDISGFDVTAGQTYTIGFDTSGTNSDGSSDVIQLNTDSSASSTRYRSDRDGNVNTFSEWADVRTEIRPNRAEYLSANHSVEDATTAKVNISSISNAEATVSIDEHDGSSWSQVTQSTFTTAGNHSIDISAATQSKLRTNVTVVNQTANGVPTFTLGDESILFEAQAPTVDNTTATPTGDLTQASNTFEIQVNDSDFPLAQGDSVTAELIIDGSSHGTDTLTQNGTASVSTTVSTGGTLTYNWTLTDDYGLESKSADFTINVPNEIEIYNETDPTSLVTKNVDLTFYVNGTQNPHDIVEKSTSNGKVDMIGIPADETIIVVAEADGYLDRRIYIPSLYETQKIYLLNDTLTHTDVLFGIEDYTGRFPPGQTVLEVQRNIQGNFTTVLGDFFGANDQFTAQIEQNVRHRLVITNTVTGESDILGTYTPLSSGTEELTVSPSGDLDLPDEHPTVEISPSTQTLPDRSGVSLSGTIANGTQDLSSWRFAVYHIDGASNTTLSDQSSTSSTGGTLSPTVDLDGKEGQVKTILQFELADGTTGSEVDVYQITQAPDHTMTLLDGIAGLIALVPGANQETVQTLGAMLVVIVGTTAVGSVFRLSAEGMGLTTVAFVAAFAVLGWLSYSLLFVVIVLAGSITFLRRAY